MLKRIIIYVMNYELTIFKSPYDNKTHRKMSLSSWAEFRGLLYNLSQKRGEKGGSNSSPLISPAIFEDGTTRANRNTTHWGGWCAIDIDDHNLGGDIEQLKEFLHGRFGKYNYLVYSTASSSKDHLKFRLLFELDQHVEREKIKALWFAVNTFVDELGDPQTKDLARMYYVPAKYPQAYDFFFYNDGVPLNTSELMKSYPYAEKEGKTFLDRLPDDLQKAVIEHRKKQLNNTNFHWTNHRDCPFIYRRQIAEYQAIQGTGWYHKSYQMMVAVASNAVRRGYPITANEIGTLFRQMDAENPITRERYKNRKYELEADGAIEYVYRNR